MSRWERVPTDFLIYWGERCETLIAEAEAEIATKQKPTAGDRSVVDLQGRQLTAIRRELDRREHV